MADMTELKKNVEAYENQKDDLISKYLGKIALFSNGELIDTYNDFQDAVKIGTDRFGAGKFSVKEITPAPRTMDYIGRNASPIGVQYLKMPCFSGLVSSNQILFNCTVGAVGSSGNPADRKPYIALLDTGAQGTAFSQKVVDDLSLVAVGWIDMTGVSGTVNVPLYEVDVGIAVQESAMDSSGNLVALSGFERAFPSTKASLADFGNNAKFDVLVGMDIINACYVTVHNGTYTICI